MTKAKAAESPYGFLDWLHSGSVSCPDPAARAAYCAAFQNYRPFSDQQQSEESFARSQAAARTAGPGAAMMTPFTDSMKLCGLNAESVRAELCARALTDAADDKDGSGAFLLDQCPDQARTLAARECAGRAYTRVMTQNVQFCGEYANRQLSGNSAGGANGASPAPADAGPAPDAKVAKPSLQDKAKSALRGLFGH